MDNTEDSDITRDQIAELMQILNADREARLLRMDAYLNGIQDDPYMPDNADSEYRLLAKRAITNVMPFLLSTPMQALYVDSFRRGSSSDAYAMGLAEDVQAIRPEWDHFQYSKLEARQHALYRGAGTFGHSFTVTEFDRKNRLHTKGLSALRTSALFDDPANDIVPELAFTVARWHRGAGKNVKPGKAYVYTSRYRYEVAFNSLLDPKFKVTEQIEHGASENPVTRFTCMVDLDGRTYGFVEPMIELQNRLNQTVFDLLIVQSLASFKVRTATGMAPPVKMQAVDSDGKITTDPTRIAGFEPVLDEQGRMIPDDIQMNAKRMLWAEDPDVKFGSLDETPLDGFLASIELAFQHIAALSQTPPHHLLGKIANISADALTAAETALARKVEELKSNFGESWERVFRLAMEMEGEQGADDYNSEVMWRDLDQRSLSQAADALGKLRETIGIPARGLWSRVPGASAQEIRQWEILLEDEDPLTVMANKMSEATSAYSGRSYSDPEKVEDGAQAQ